MRKEAASRLRDYVVAQNRELSVEAFSKFMSDLNKVNDGWKEKKKEVSFFFRGLFLLSFFSFFCPFAFGCSY